MDNSTIVEAGARIAREETIHRGSTFWREPLFGIIPVPFLWNIFTVILVALIFWWLIRNSHKTAQTTEGPQDLLKRRYASGEIDRKTYLQIKEDITD
jgi:uncharacterized membrane protein